MRLNKYLATSGVASRRAAEKLIVGGNVRINGKVVRELATFVEPGKDKVEVNGTPVAPPRLNTYILLHKPEGFITTSRDPGRRPTVMELVPKEPRVFSVGRLDLDTTGVLMLTDDGELANLLTHPRYGIEKEYLVTVRGTVKESTIKQLATGVKLEDGMTAPCQASLDAGLDNRSRVRLILHEGRNRQVRRMMEAVGHTVIDLTRVRMGPLTLEGLPTGNFRELKQKEVRALRRGIDTSERKTDERSTKHRATKTNEKPPGKTVPKTETAPAETPSPGTAAKPSAGPAPRTAAKSAAKPGPKTAAKPSARPAPRTAAKSAAKPGPKTAAKPGARSAPKRGTQSDTRASSKPGARPARRSGPKSGPKPGPKTKRR